MGQVIAMLMAIPTEGRFHYPMINSRLHCFLLQKRASEHRRAGANVYKMVDEGLVEKGERIEYNWVKTRDRSSTRKYLGLRPVSINGFHLVVLMPPPQDVWIA